LSTGNNTWWHPCINHFHCVHVSPFYATHIHLSILHIQPYICCLPLMILRCRYVDDGNTNSESAVDDVCSLHGMFFTLPNSLYHLLLKPVHTARRV
jgi:hypothetical protein